VIHSINTLIIRHSDHKKKHFTADLTRSAHNNNFTDGEIFLIYTGISASKLPSLGRLEKLFLA
jgi:hypothetical protein